MILPTNFWPVRQWRKARNWALRQKMYAGLSRGLLDEKRWLVAPSMPTPCEPNGTRLSPGELRRLTHLNFWLGSGPVWYIGPKSPAAYLRDKRMQAKLIEEVLTEEDPEAGARREAERQALLEACDEWRSMLAEDDRNGCC